jgi:hypothetical protein
MASPRPNQECRPTRSCPLRLMESFGPPILSFNWVDNRLSPLSIVADAAPAGPGEFVIDVGTADREGFELGEYYDVGGRESFTLDEQWRLNGSQGRLNWIDVATAGDVTP